MKLFLCQLAVGPYHMAAILRTGVLVLWGENSCHQVTARSTGPIVWVPASIVCRAFKDVSKHVVDVDRD